MGRIGLEYGDVVLYADGSSRADAQALAALADVAVVVVSSVENESFDRPNLDMQPGPCLGIFCQALPIDQNALIADVAAVNPNTVVAIMAGAPVSMPWLDAVSAVTDFWFAGIEQGNAIANILYGRANPSGKLPRSFPKQMADTPFRAVEQYPGVNFEAEYSERLLVGYRWYDEMGIEPLFPFGFGLSYTRFTLSDLVVQSPGDRASVNVTLENIGERTGAESVQVYVGFPVSAFEPPRQLKGFRKAKLAPGESQVLSIELDWRAFASWDEAIGDWLQAPGCYEVLVGHSSRDLPLTARIPIAGGVCPADDAPRSVLVGSGGLRGGALPAVVLWLLAGYALVRRRSWTPFTA